MPRRVERRNVPAPPIAIAYWRMPADATLRDVVLAVRADEAGHRDRNHGFADSLKRGEAPVGETQTAIGVDVATPRAH